MARNVRTARGEVVDFDTIIIKQQLAAAPMNVEVAKRRQFIDSKEGKARGGAKPVVETIPSSPVVVTQPTPAAAEIVPASQARETFDATPPVVKGPVIEPVINLPERGRKKKNV